MRLLTPTENRRLNEMVGFLGITLAILMALALLSYSPHDASFNVAAQAPESHPARNWIGPAGAYGADLFFQVFGYAAFLLPMGICALGLRWFRSHPLDSAIATLIGYAMLVFSRAFAAGAVAACRTCAERFRRGDCWARCSQMDCAQRSIPWARIWWPWRSFSPRYS